MTQRAAPSLFDGHGHFSLAHRLLLGPAILLLETADAVYRLWRLIWSGVARLGQIGALPRLRARVARLPPALALPLFLVPEGCSRCGWLASAWLLMQGREVMALEVYVATKLVAGLTALWVLHACEPALMRVRWFARLRTRSTQAAARLHARITPDLARCPVLAHARRIIQRRKDPSRAR